MRSFLAVSVQIIGPRELPMVRTINTRTTFRFGMLDLSVRGAFGITPRMLQVSMGSSKVRIALASDRVTRTQLVDHARDQRVWEVRTCAYESTRPIPPETTLDEWKRQIPFLFDRR